MAGEDMQVFLHTEGESFRANCSHDVHKNLHEKKFWCKELSEKSCLVLALNSPLKERINLNHALHRSVDLIDLGRGWFSVIMTALRRENSGTYQCGVRGDLKNILLQRIQMVVSLEGELWGQQCTVGDSQNKSRMICHLHFCFMAKHGVSRHRDPTRGYEGQGKTLLHSSI